MPELPEVETLKRELARVLLGKKIKTFESGKFDLALAGKEITAINRRAKVLILEFKASPAKLRHPAKSFLLVHLKMTGQLVFIPKTGRLIMGGHPEDPHKHTRAIFTFTDGSKLLFNDLRKFGWLRLASETDLHQLHAAVGVEPLSREFTAEKFKTILARHPNRPLKALLLDQSLVAGLGNIYVDEACFGARVLPTRRACGLTKAEIKKLHEAIVSVLKLSISKKGTSARNYVRADGSKGGFVPYLNVYGRSREKCKRCGQPIVKIKFAGRGTHYCANCQK